MPVNRRDLREALSAALIVADANILHVRKPGVCITEPPIIRGGAWCGRMAAVIIVNRLNQLPNFDG